jgi:hypothetical protein
MTAGGVLLGPVLGVAHDISRRLIMIPRTSLHKEGLWTERFHEAVCAGASSGRSVGMRKGKLRGAIFTFRVHQVQGKRGGAICFDDASAGARSLLAVLAASLFHS